MYYGHMICMFVYETYETYETYDQCVYELNICCIFTLFAFGKFLLLRHVIYLIYLKLYLNIHLLKVVFNLFTETYSSPLLHCQRSGY